MKIYQLTRTGRSIARTTNNPDTANWRVIHYMDGLGTPTASAQVTFDQIVMGTGLDEGQAAGSLALLRKKEIVAGG